MKGELIFRLYGKKHKAELTADELRSYEREKKKLFRSRQKVELLDLGDKNLLKQAKKLFGYWYDNINSSWDFEHRRFEWLATSGKYDFDGRYWYEKSFQSMLIKLLKKYQSLKGGELKEFEYEGKTVSLMYEAFDLRYEWDEWIQVALKRKEALCPQNDKKLLSECAVCPKKMRNKNEYGECSLF